MTSSLQRAKAVPMVKEWLKQNFEPRPGGCVAKREVYEAYVAFCESANLQATNDATFGKIFRATFPNVQVRRLVRRVKAKKWHYCEVAYRPGSSLAAAAENAGQLSTDTPLAYPANGEASSPATKKRKRSSCDQGEAEEDSKREREENEEQEKDEDAQTVLRQRKSPRKEERHHVSTIKEERRLSPPGTSSSDNEASDEDQEEGASGRTPSYDDSDRIHGAGVDNKSTPAELGDSGTWRRELDQGLLSSGSTASTFSSLLHSSSGFSLRPNITESDRMLLAGSGAFAFGPARKRPGLCESLVDHSSLTSSSAEVFFSYQPASMEPFVRPEPVDRFASYHPHPHLPIADGEPASPASMASPAIASSSGATSPSSYSSAMPSPLIESSPSPFEASLSLPVHRTQTGQMMHTHTLLSSTHLPIPQHYSSLASTTQSFRQLPTLPSVNPPLTIHPYPSLPYRSLLNPSSQNPPPLPIPTTSISTHVPLPPIAAAMNCAQPSASGTSSQGDKEMSPDSMEIFISHLLTDKSGEVMTLRPM